MSIKVQSVEAMAALFQSRLPMLADPITVVQAPPSESATYPAMAIEINGCKRKWLQKTEITVDANGVPRTGTNMKIDNDAGAAVIAPGTTLVRYGMLYVRGKLWIAARLPPQREQMEDIVEQAFNAGMTPGKLSISMRPSIGGIVLPWDWTVAAFIGDTTWSDEYGWSERLWAWMDYDLELPLLAPKNDPLVTQLRLVVDVDARQPTSGDTVVDLDGGADNETYSVDQQGNITIIP